MRSRRWLWPAAACLMWAGGCAHANYTLPERYEHGLVVCLSGSGRMMNEIRDIRRGLAEGGVDGAIEAFEWSRFMLDLTSVERKKELASRLARRSQALLRDRLPIHQSQQPIRARQHRARRRRAGRVRLVAQAGALLQNIDHLEGDGWRHTGIFQRLLHLYDPLAR